MRSWIGWAMLSSLVVVLWSIIDVLVFIVRAGRW